MTRIEKQLQKIAAEWRRQAARNRKTGQGIWRKLRTGELEQIDGTIYKVYSLEAAADALDLCAAQIEKSILLNVKQRNRKGAK